MNQNDPKPTTEPIGPHITLSKKSIFEPPPPQALPLQSSSRTRRIRPGLVKGAASAGSQKRARHTYKQDSTMTTPLNEWSDIPSIPSSACFSAVPSPSPFVNTKYQLAGGLDTPTAAIEARYEMQEQMDLDQDDDLRLNRLRPSTTNQWKDSYFPRTPGSTATDVADRRKRKQSDQSGWGMTLVSAVGGIAWKGINLCWTSAFGGFQAGGGGVYRVPSNKPSIVRQESWVDVGEKEDVFNAKYEGEDYSLSRTIPGQFPEDMEEEGEKKEEEEKESAGETDICPLQTVEQSKGNELPAMKPRYKLVAPSDLLTAESTSHARRRSTSSAQSRSPSQASMASMRPRSKPHHRPSNSHAGSPSLHKSRPGSVASVASARRLQRTSEPDFSRFRTESPIRHRPSISSIAPTYAAAAPRLSHSRQSSTPVSPDVLKFERKIRSKERKEDENIRRLNQQLKDMIREGREALATRIDIEDESETEPEDEGYVEGDEEDRPSHGRIHKW